MSGLNIPYLYNNNAILPSISTVGQVKDTIAAAEAQGATDAVSFADLLQQAIAGTVSTDAEAKVSDIGMLLGEVQDLHTVGITGQKADIMLNLTVQVRDRVIEAYQEIMRMQV